ncbi:hypothetical protein SDC9_07434 [bioreactor metagenome]|uniref:Uncharacterized protein n=1 Tax=bioreactor metagenome TaxID=1076179 RepID=A0A644T4J3_9ZZZZ|nr:hypothetical protein [Methanobrevibacter sp.]MEA4956891.1 hypothetical protein [Methanobrevibacter sp.]
MNNENCVYKLQRHLKEIAHTTTKQGLMSYKNYNALKEYISLEIIEDTGEYLIIKIK